MSYELYYKNQVQCPCGEGYIIRTTESNDWNQTNDKIVIVCKNCNRKYHIEYEYVQHGDHSDCIPYLVPKGETLYRNNCYNIYEDDFPTQLCKSFSLEALSNVYSVLCESSSSSNISDEQTRKIIRRSKSVISTIRISKIREGVNEAIHRYNSLEINYDKDTERITNVRKKCMRIKDL